MYLYDGPCNVEKLANGIFLRQADLTGVEGGAKAKKEQRPHSF